MCPVPMMFSNLTYFIDTYIKIMSASVIVYVLLLISFTQIATDLSN